jgi:hypothetical protein
VLDPYGRDTHLSVTAAHAPGCVFGDGWYRIVVGDEVLRFVQDEAELRQALLLLLGLGKHIVVQHDACLDGLRRGDASTPDVVDAEWWLGLSQAEGMAELGLTDAAEYARAYRAIENAVAVRNNRASQTGVRAPIVVKRKGAFVRDVA